jgi:galactoside 2-L-fucosyltransferase 1/2
LRLDSKHCGYDPNNVNITKNKNIAFEGYFQSWKYWKKYEKEVKQMFTFKPEISHNAQNQLKKVLKSKGITQGDGTVLVGVHIRYWEEYYNSIIGKNQAPKSYVTNAVNYFRRKFKKVLFIVATNSVSWARTMLNNGSDTIILEGNSAPVDMATLSLTNHTIMTVGSFGWLIGWLTGGITVYYKYPDEPGSKYAAQFHPGRVDHFYPGWIGME